MGGLWLELLKGLAWVLGFGVALYKALGPVYVAAVVLDFSAIIAEGGAKGKKTAEEEQDEPKGPGIAAFIMSALSSLATAFLFVHILLHTEIAFDRRLQIGAGAIVMFMVLTGSLYGELIARMAPNFAAICRAVKLPLTVAAFGLTLIATYQSLILFFGIAMAMFH